MFHLIYQDVLATDENVVLLHHLEQVSSEEMVGSLAENLMEALREFPEGKKKVCMIWSVREIKVVVKVVFTMLIRRMMITFF